MRPQAKWTWALASLFPVAALGAGTSLVTLSAAEPRPQPPEVWVALVVAAVAPLVTVLSCGKLRPGADCLLLGASFMLTSVSMTCLLGLSATTGTGADFFSTVVARHGMFIGAGCLALLLGLLISDRLDVAARYPYTMAATALTLTAITIAAGTTVNGARLWLGVGPVRFQPSEIARILIAGFVAAYLYERRHLVAAAWRVGVLDLPPAPYLVPIGAALLAVTTLLVLQNDLGMAALLSLGVVAGTVSSLRSRTSVAGIMLLFGLAVLAAYQATPRVQARVDAWIDPWRDGASAGYQFIQAEYVLASGGLLGAGASVSAVSVPEVQTDFVLAAVGSQLGFLTVIAVIALSIVIVFRCVINGLQATSGFGTLLCCCLAALLGIQLMLIAGGALRVLPLTGVTYPLVSYGGTSMLATLFVIGVVAGTGAKQSIVALQQNV